MLPFLLGSYLFGITNKVVNAVPITLFPMSLMWTVLHNFAQHSNFLGMHADSRTDCNFKLVLSILYTHHRPLLPFSSANTSFLVY